MVSYPVHANMLASACIQASAVNLHIFIFSCYLTSLNGTQTVRSTNNFFWMGRLIFYSLMLKEMLRPIPVALASCTRYFEAMSAMRESLATLQHLRVASSSLPVTPAKDNSRGINEPECVTPPPWRENRSSEDLLLGSQRRQEVESQGEDGEVGDSSRVDNLTQRRLSWPPSVKKSIEM